MDNSDIEILIISIATLLALFSFLKDWRISVSVIISSLAGLVLDHFGKADYYTFVLLWLCAPLCILRFDSIIPKTTKKEDDKIGYAMCYLYVLRAFFLIPSIYIGSNIESLWIISSVVFFAAQLILMVGNGVGYGKRINSGLARVGNSIDDAVFQLKKLWF